MGFFGRLKRVARGAVKLEVSVPPSFSWSSDVLPVAITLTNEDDDARTVRKIEVELEKVGGGQRPAKCDVDLHEEIHLEPGQTVHLQIPLPVGAAAAATGLDLAEWARTQGLPDWVGQMKFKQGAGGMGRVPMTGRHEVEVEINLSNGRVIEKRVHTEAV